MKSRIQSSFRNIYSGILLQVLNILLNIITRRFFVITFGIEILGLNGVMINIISMLSLTELGIGIAISQSLYEPLALKNDKQVACIMRLYAKFYHAIGFIILLIGICMLPVLKNIIDINRSEQYVYSVYGLFLLDSVLSYFFSYRQNILVANQEKYILNILFICSYIGQNIMQILAMIFCGEYLIYLLIKLFCNLFQNMIVYIMTNVKYPYLQKKTEKLDKKYKKNIINNAKALVLANISTYIIFGTDNIILSLISGTVIVGLYSNYSMIITAVKNLISQIFQGITASYGNYLISHCLDDAYILFKNIYFVNFWIATFCSTALMGLISSFISLWIGEEYILSCFIVGVLIWNFYSDMMRSSVELVRNAYGLYSPYPFFKYWIFIEAIINIIFSLLLGYWIGIIGVFIGTAISAFISCYVMPWNLYKYVFKRSSKQFYKDYMKYQAKSVFIVLIVYYLCNIINIQNIYFEFILKILVVIIVPNFMLFIFSRNSNEFQFLKNILLKRVFKYRI